MLLDALALCHIDLFADRLTSAPDEENS